MPAPFHFVELTLHHNGEKACINMALIEGFFPDGDGTVLVSQVPTTSTGDTNNWTVKESYAEVAALIGMSA